MRRVALSVLLLILMLPGRSLAGNNANGKAWLSWDREGFTTRVVSSAAADSSLYLHLADAPDIEGLGIEIRWSTGDSAGCYRFVPTDPQTDCGWTTETPPSEPFGGTD